MMINLNSIPLQIHISIWYISSTGFSLFLQNFFNSVQSNDNNISIYSIICLAAFIQNLSCWLIITILYTISVSIHRKNEISLIQHLNNIKYEKKSQLFFIFAGLLHCFTVLIMNVMLTLSNIPCVHTVRALEPLLSSMFVYFIPIAHKNRNIKVDNIEKYIGTILMLFGFLLATWKSDQCNLWSIITVLGLLTNLGQVLRNISIQYVSKEKDELVFQIILYGISTIISFLLLITTNGSYGLLKDYASLLCLITLCSFIYNITSIIVCSQVEIISYSLLTMLKRPILIFASMIYFDSLLSFKMIIGNIIILIGITFYQINPMILFSIIRKKIYSLIWNLFLIFSIITLFSLLYRNSFVPIKTENEDLPLFYWKPSNTVEDNFGDKLSHVLVQSMVGRNISVITDNDPNLFCQQRKLLAIGSILGFACENDVIWGSGILAPLDFPFYLSTNLLHTLDIRAVRGPRTREILTSKFNLTVPEIYGDPALLLPYYLTSYKKFKKPLISILLILHYVDVEKQVSISGLNRIVTVHALLPWDQILNLIIQSELVISTSLHGIILSEAFGIPARLLKSPFLDLFEFYDYYEGTNRTLRYATTIAEAIQMGGEIPPQINLTKLLNAFPFDKFRVDKI